MVKGIARNLLTLLTLLIVIMILYHVFIAGFMYREFLFRQGINNLNK
jgi:hypothetical protein